MSEIPNPGSDEAVENGCKCPRLDNNHGKWLPWIGSWWLDIRCPVHGWGSGYHRDGD